MTLPTELHPALRAALTDRGYETLTPVQLEMIRTDLESKDLLVSAQTGSGKTVGFGVAMAPTLLGEDEQLPPAGAPMALVIAPTRELALQVRREFEWLYRSCGARLGSCVGGMDMRTERRALEKGTHIVVGTPGRLRDHIQRESIDMSQIRCVVLDEADEMLDLGFAEDLEFILDTAPEGRRTLMFSATVPRGIESLSKKFMKSDAERVKTISNTPQHADISYQAFSVMPHQVDAAVINTLRLHEAENAIVFCNTRVMVSRLTARLSNRGFQVVALSGELSQTERSHALQAMRDGRARVCVATDVAARGIDLPKLDLVVHAELPSNSETLLHRSGRTGRAGRKGVSVVIATPKVRKKAERLLGWAKVSATWGDVPSADAVRLKDRERMLADPIWETPEEDHHDDVALLAERFSPAQLAEAYLSLYEARHAPPEELEAAEESRRPRQEFGPSAWISLTLGRKERAEARWILPLLLRSGGLKKEEIGAIRPSRDLTYVELQQKAHAAFLARVGDGEELEDGVRVAVVHELPDLPKPEPRKSRFEDGDRPQRPHRKGPREDFGDSPRPPRRPRPDATEKSFDKPAAQQDDRPKRTNPKQMAREWDDRRSEKPSFKREKPQRDPAVHDGLKKSPRKAAEFSEADAKDRKPRHKPGAGAPGERPAGKPFGKPGGKPAGKPAGKPFGKPEGKSFGKSEGKSFGKPEGKSPGKPGGKGPKGAKGKGFTPTPKEGFKARPKRAERGPDAVPRRKPGK